jgi:hypothetical protein
LLFPFWAVVVEARSNANANELVPAIADRRCVRAMFAMMLKK